MLSVECGCDYGLTWGIMNAFMYFGNVVKVRGGKILFVKEGILMFGDDDFIFGLICKHFDFYNLIG